MNAALVFWCCSRFGIKPEKETLLHFRSNALMPRGNSVFACGCGGTAVALEAGVVDPDKFQELLAESPKMPVGWRVYGSMVSKATYELA